MVLQSPDKLDVAVQDLGLMDCVSLSTLSVCFKLSLVLHRWVSAVQLGIASNQRQDNHDHNHDNASPTHRNKKWQQERKC